MKPDHIVRYHAEKKHEQFLEKESVATSSNFEVFVSLQEVEEAWSLLGIQNKTKDSKVKQNVFKNIVDAIKTIGKSRKKDTSVTRRIIKTMIISSSTKQKCLTT